MSLDEEQRRRYARHLVIPELGAAGQQKLAGAAVLVVGAGGLGSPALFYLAAAGVGRLGVIDDDVVELSNLQRQIVHTTADIGRPKAVSAAEKLRALNPEVVVDVHEERFAAGNALDLLAGYDVIVDAVDNFSSRFLVNDACVLAGTPLVEGAILRFTGLALTVRPRETACYRCVFPELPDDGSLPAPSQAGVFGPVPGVIGAVQAAETIKLITGCGRPLFDRLLEFDALDLTFDEVRVTREPGCPVCGERPSITALHDDAYRPRAGGGAAQKGHPV